MKQIIRHVPVYLAMGALLALLALAIPQAVSADGEVIYVTKSVTPTQDTQHHGVVTYTIVLTNAHPLSETNVLITDTLPTEVDFARWITNPGAIVVNDVLTWTGTLTSSTALTFTFAVTHTGDYDEVITNTAYFSGVLQTGKAVVTHTVMPNYAPVLAIIEDQTINELETLAFTATATDTNRYDLLTFTLDTGSVGHITADGVYSWTTDEIDGPGIYTATVSVSDGILSDTQTFSITINEVNQPPVLRAIGDRAVDEWDKLTFTARATDPDLPANPLTYTLDAGSVGSIDPGTGVFEWRAGAVQAGATYTATIRVSDGALEDSETFAITVNEVQEDKPGTGHWIAVANRILSNFSMVNTADDTVYGPFLQYQLGASYNLFDVAITPDGQTALFSNFGDAAVYLVDITNPISPSSITSITLPFWAEDIDISSDGQYALVTDGGLSSMVASINIPSATLVYTTDMGSPDAQAVEIAPDNTVIVADYLGGAIHTLLLGETGEVITTGHTYTYTYPGYAITDTAGSPWPINVGIAPDGQTVIVLNAFTSTVGIYQIIAPGVLTFTGVVTGLHGAYPEYDGFGPGTQSVAFNETGDKAYVVIDGMLNDSGTNTGDRIGVLNITGPGQVSLSAGEVATLPHATTGQFFGVDVIAFARDKLYVGYPGSVSDDYFMPLAIVDLSDYSVASAMVLTNGVSIPTGVAAVPLPLHLDMHQTVSDSEPVPGQIITYTLVLSNTGAQQISRITLRDVLPPEVELAGPVAIVPPGAGITSSVLPELVTSLVISGHQQVTVTFPAQVGLVPPDTRVENTVLAESPELETPARAWQTFNVAPHLALHKAINNTSPNPHQVITYTLTLSNTGAIDDPAVVLTDTLPDQVTFNDWGTQPAGATIHDNEISWTGPLTGGTALTFTFSITQTGSYNEIITNTAEINGMGQTVTTTVTYTVASNVAPVLDALDNRTIDELVTLVFTATASDANGYPPLVYTLDEGSVGSITSGGVFTWTPTEADGPGVYSTTVRVSDGELDDYETITITVNEVNQAPTANAGVDQTVEPGNTVTLDGSGSSDPDGDTLTYEWAQTGGTIVTLSDIHAMQPTFTTSETGILTFTLTVTDSWGMAATMPDTVQITVTEIAYKVFLPLIMR